MWSEKSHREWEMGAKYHPKIWDHEMVDCETDDEMVDVGRWDSQLISTWGIKEAMKKKEEKKNGDGR